MVSNKKRLYVALYPSGVTHNDERGYHWGFLVGPKVEGGARVPGTRYHVKNHPINGWIYEEVRLENVQTTTKLLARIVVAKVQDEERRATTIRETPMVQNDASWRCRSWVADVLARLAATKDDNKAVGTARLDWSEIERLGRAYVAEKAAAGRYARVADLELPKPTWDMLENRETVS